MEIPGKDPKDKTRQGLSREDLLSLELLEKTRSRRQLDIIEAAKRARLSDDLLERDITNSAVLAGEAIKFNELMMRLNRRVSIRRLLGHSAIRTVRGEISHYPRSFFGNNHYKVSTPVLLATDPEFIQESQPTDGYVFSTDHGRRGESLNPTVIISRVFSDLNTGVQRTIPHEYIIHTAGQESGHPFSIISGSAVDKLGVYVAGDDPCFIEPIGLVKLAIEEIAA